MVLIFLSNKKKDFETVLVWHVPTSSNTSTSLFWKPQISTGDAAKVRKKNTQKKRVFVVGLKWCAAKHSEGQKSAKETCEASASVWAKKYDSVTWGRVWLTTRWPCAVPPPLPNCIPSRRTASSGRGGYPNRSRRGPVDDKTHRASPGSKLTNCSGSLPLRRPLPRSDPSLCRLCIAPLTDC